MYESTDAELAALERCQQAQSCDSRCQFCQRNAPSSCCSGVVRSDSCASMSVVLRQVIPFDVRSEVLRKQISRELRTLAGSRHPNIVAYYQSFLEVCAHLTPLDRSTAFHLVLLHLHRLSALCWALRPLSGASYISWSIHVFTHCSLYALSVLSASWHLKEL